MRIACVLIPSFAVAVERLRTPRLAEQPVVVYDRAAAGPIVELCQSYLDVGLSITSEIEVFLQNELPTGNGPVAVGASGRNEVSARRRQGGARA